MGKRISTVVLAILAAKEEMRKKFWEEKSKVKDADESRKSLTNK